MSFKARRDFTIPDQTATVAAAAFPKGTLCLTIRDELGPIYNDEEFAPLFSGRGQPGIAPGLLATVIVLQYLENLTDRQAAEQVRARIDWKYLLGLELTDPGFHYSVLSEFRDRLLENELEMRLLDTLLERLAEKGLVKAGGKQRTDSTHVLLAVRQLHRLELIGETMRWVLDDVAKVAPEWLLSQLEPEWFKTYSRRFDQYRLPKKKSKRTELAQKIGADGDHLLQAIYAEEAPVAVRDLPSVDVMRQIWMQQFYLDQGQLKWREQKNLPPYKDLIQSPYDLQGRNRTKGANNWTGYTAHFTETCDEERPNIITHAETNLPTTGDIKKTPQIHQALKQKALLPSEHYVDKAYMSVKQLLAAQTEYELDLAGQLRDNPSWQAQTEGAYDLTCFVIDWPNQIVTCPQGQTSQKWSEGLKDQRGNDIIQVRFSKLDCLPCPARENCTHAKETPRYLTFRPQVEQEAINAARARQETDEFKERFKSRAGIEGTISQSVRMAGLRHARYIGLAKTHLQNVATAAALNLSRVANWLNKVPKAKTRPSPFTALKSHYNYST